MMSEVADKPKVSMPASSAYTPKPAGGSKETGKALAPVAVTEETVGTRCGLAPISEDLGHHAATFVDVCQALRRE